jgi:hypothetical protein
MDQKWQIRIRKQYKLESEGDQLPNQVNWAENWRFRNSTGMDGKWNKYKTTTASFLIEKQNIDHKWEWQQTRKSAK